jgi:hypothetical protein
MQTTAFLGVAHIHTPGFINMLKGRDDVRVKAVYDHDAQRGQQRATELEATFLPTLTPFWATRKSHPSLFAAKPCTTSSWWSVRQRRAKICSSKSHSRQR